MLSIGVVTVGGIGYYLDTVASGVDDYYVEADRGRWAGIGASLLGLSGEVGDDAIMMLAEGRHPSTGALLGARPGKVAAYDLTFSAPKSVSVLAGLGDPRTAEAVEAAHRRAVTATLTVLEAHAARGRRGRGGVTQVELTGVIAAGFEHRTSRAGDPQLHTHLLVVNRAEGVDGRWGALHGRRVFAWAKTGGYLYQAALRGELTAALGVTWGPVSNGTAEITGIDRQVLEAFSTRRAQIVAALDTAGHTSPRAGQVAALASRPPKPEPIPAAIQQEKWWATATAAGLDPARLAAVVGRAVPAPGLDPGTVERLARALALAGPAGLTAHRSSFDRRDLYQAHAQAARAGAWPDQVTAAADTFADHRGVVATGRDHPLAGPTWTTAELLTAETAVLDSAARRRHTHTAVIADGDLAEALAERPSLSAEQQAMVARLCAAGNGVEVVVGRAGTGKTFALDAARAGWSQAGIPVIGAALAARTAHALQAGTGIPSTTVDQLLADLGRPSPQPALPVGGVLIIDEAGMVGTRKLAAVAAAAERYRTKLVLVGDARQLPEIDAGGAFAALAKTLDPVELTHNRRQAAEWERDALDQVRAGDPAAAVVVYRDHRRLTLAPTADAARQALIADWSSSRAAGQSTLIVASTRAEVDDLNDLARQHLTAAGALGDPTVTAGGRQFAVGDEVCAWRNDRRIGILNGTRATITAIDANNGDLTLAVAGRAVPAGRSVVVPYEYAEAGHLGHGYATTIHKAQGITVDRALVLGSDRLYREAGYTALSRARDRTDLYHVAPHPARWEPNLDPTDHLASLLGRSHAQHLAGPQPPPVVPGSAPVPVTQATLADLAAQRAGIERRLVADLPDARTDRPSGPQIADAAEAARGHSPDPDLVAWAAGHRHDLQALHLNAARSGRRVADLRDAALADPGNHLTDRLGPPPPVPGPARRAWTAAALAIDTYRDSYGVTGPDPLGPRPADADQTRHHDHARIAAHQADMHLHRDLEHGLSL
ncbi:MAG: MobF family relaxase [Acidimicrobiales bacterium]